MSQPLAPAIPVASSSLPPVNPCIKRFGRLVAHCIDRGQILGWFPSGQTRPGPHAAKTGPAELGGLLAYVRPGEISRSEARQSGG